MLPDLFLKQLIAVGSRCRGASTSMLRLPSRPVARLVKPGSPASSNFGTLSPTAPRRSKDGTNSNTTRSDGRIDQVEHIATSLLGRALLTTGSALGLLNNPSRGESGRRLLIERPSVNSETVDVEYLASLERGTFGREWVEWLKENGVGPDGRAEADYMPTSEQKYLIQRYRESHDFYHLLLRMPVTQLGETVVKYFEMAQMQMPVAGFAAVGGTLRILASNLSSLPKPSQLISRALGQADASQNLPSSADLSALQTLVPWAMEVGRTSVPLISIEWERCWEKNIEEMRHELGITQPPIHVAKFAGRAKKGGKRRGWPSKILQHEKAKQQQQQAHAVPSSSSTS
uniref:4-hydroxy-3-methoxy-5-polyprenylbenzoate decarboxylase n=1 Tax=Kalmanozyma brasiliensis (strain GHG001) TaxID=1365824 RepID=V5ETW5_KALBG